MGREYQRPIVQPTSAFGWVIGDDDPSVALQLAHDTSWALLHRVRSGADPQVVSRVLELAAGDGIHDLAELWSSQDTHSLAGVMWRIFLLRRVVSAHPEQTADLFRRGAARIGTIDVAVAGASEPVTPDTVMRLCDQILTGVFFGDLGDALDRAIAYARIMSVGAADLADDRDTLDDPHAAELTARALRYATIARELERGAQRWRLDDLE